MSLQATINGTFTSCKGDDQLPVGHYVSGGQTYTYYQPAESLGEITTIPYTPSIPATSQCSTYTSSNLFTDLANYYSSVSGSMTTSAPTSGSTSAAGASSTNSAKAAGAVDAAKSTSSSTKTGAAGKLGVSAALALGAIIGAAAVLA